MNSEQPVLPYPEPGGAEFTAGHSGSDTSRERAVDEARSGKMQARQILVMSYFHVMRAHGLTVAEVREMTDLHHGQASSVLSVLHKEGRLARLTEKRERCAVYVLPEYVGDRAAAPYRPNKKNRTDPARDLLVEYSNLRARLGPYHPEWREFDKKVSGYLDG